VSRTRIQLPETFSFRCEIPVRITDVNYGGHVGNDTILSILHEARMQFLKQHGYTELEFCGVGLIMADVQVEYRSEVFYPDTVTAFLEAADFTAAGFDLYYRLEGSQPAPGRLLAVARTGMICFDYTRKKVLRLPADARAKLSGEQRHRMLNNER